MQTNNSLFAIPLTFTSRFLGALEITRVKLNVRHNVTGLLMALLEKEGDLTPKQRSAHSVFHFAGDRKKEMREFFWKTYNDEESICAYLNKQVSINYFKKKKRKGETAVDASIRNILESGLGMDFLLNDEL